MTTPATTDQTVDLLIVLDKQCNGASAASSLLYYTGGGATSVDGYSTVYYDPQYSHRFRVLKRVRIMLPSGFPVSNGTNHIVTGSHRRVRFTIKFKKPLKYDYSSTSGGVADLNSNNILMFCATTGAAGTVKYYFTARTRYID